MVYLFLTQESPRTLYSYDAYKSIKIATQYGLHQETKLKKLSALLMPVVMRGFVFIPRAPYRIHRQTGIISKGFVEGKLD